MTSERQQACLDAVRGPVFPIPTPFTEDERVDYAALESYVDWLVGQGAATIMVTVGTSRFSLLTYEEMRLVNQTVAAAVSGRAYTIVTTPASGSLAVAGEFARHAANIGADAMLGVYPERFYSEEAVYGYFKSLAEAAELGIMIHLAPMAPGKTGLGPSVNYAPELVDRLASLPNMVGMKEESNNPQLIYAYNRLLKNRFCVIGGSGCMRAYFTASAWEQPAYLVGIGNYAPRVELDFFQALQGGDLDTARRIIDEHEKPFFDMAVGMGWHLALKEAMAARKLMAAWERKPLARLSKAERKQIQSLVGEV